MYDCLKDDGKFVIEMLTPNLKTETFGDWEETNRKTREDGKTIVQYSKSFFDEKNQLITYPLKYELLDGGAKVMETEEMILDIKLHEKEEFQGILEEASFNVVNKYNGHSNEPATDESELVIYECVK